MPSPHQYGNRRNPDQNLKRTLKMKRNTRKENIRRTMAKALRVLLALTLLSAWCGEAPAKVIRVLAIGNSFSEDAVEQNLHELGMATGDTMIVGNLYIGGCTLERHWRNASGNAAEYRYRKVAADGKRTQENNVTIAKGLADEPWDYVSLQQASGVSGMEKSFEPYLTHMVEYVRDRLPNAKLLWHMTWAYAKDSNHREFANYHNDQTEMYHAIISAAKKAMADHGITTVVPSGTAVQNARTSAIGDHMNRDGFHLDYRHGRYTAACTWYETLTGRNVVGNSYVPQGLAPETARLAQMAAHAAVKKPWKVTDQGRKKQK